MDSVAGLLDGPRARGAFLLQSVLDPPWSMRIQDEAPLTLIAMVAGDAWVLPDDGEPRHLAEGDIAIARGPSPYVIADLPTTAPQVVIQPGQRCETPEGLEIPGMMDLGVRTWGTGPEGSTVMLTGVYELRSETSRRLLDALPPLLVLTGDEWETPLVGFLASEIVRDEPGQDAVLDRLLDLLLVAVLREWFSRPEAAAPGWYRAHGDPTVGPALRALQQRPADPWTVERLAAEVRVSRAALARAVP